MSVAGSPVASVRRRGEPEPKADCATCSNAATNPGGWPKGGVTIVDLPNDHLQYAITWFGLALGLLAVYLSYHIQKGRLGLR